MSVYFKGFDTLPKGSESSYEDADSLDSLFEGQKALMEMMNYSNFPKDVYFLLTAQNLQSEVVESVEFYGDITKPWKESYEFDIEHLKEEWVDVLFFWLQGAITLGITPNELFELYFAKHAKNVKRIESKVKSETN